MFVSCSLALLPLRPNLVAVTDAKAQTKVPVPDPVHTISLPTGPLVAADHKRRPAAIPLSLSPASFQPAQAFPPFAADLPVRRPQKSSDLFSLLRKPPVLTIHVSSDRCALLETSCEPCLSSLNNQPLCRPLRRRHHGALRNRPPDSAESEAGPSLVPDRPGLLGVLLGDCSLPRRDFSHRGPERMDFRSGKCLRSAEGQTAPRKRTRVGR